VRLDEIAQAIEKLPYHEQEGFLKMLAEYEASIKREKSQKDFMVYVKEMWPGFVAGRHHKVMAQKFQEIADGKLKRLIICLAPRHTKSEFASYLLPSWFLGKYPEKKVIQASNTAELAVGFGRKVRNLVGSEQYAQVFPNVSLRSDSKAAGRWSTNHGGEYFAIGVGGTMTGKGADLAIIDDPHSEQEARLAATNPEVFDSVFEWYTSGPRQRLQPNGAIIIVMCMTGDTPVLMADGTQKPLRDIRPADMVATFDNGNLSVSKINNWRSSGVDSIYRIQTQSGKILRSNERHPFLVMNEGVLEWTRLNQLRVGDLLVSLKDAAGHQNQKQSQTYANHVTQERFITKKTLMRHTFRLGLMASGKVNLVIVASQLFARACALLATESNTRIQSKPRSKTELDASSIGTASLWQSMKQWLQREIIDAMYAVKSLIRKTPALIGMESSALITAMTQAKSEGYSATTATLLLDTERRQAYLNELHRISDFTVDPIVSITTDGQEEVFDVEVDRTENFIANGVVSHNTRWSKKDLVGKVLQSMIDRDGEKWEVIEFPAIMPSGQPLWPEFWSLDLLTALKDELPVAKWNAQYQQNPTSEEGAIIRREWWMPWEKADPPHCEYIIMTLDAAAETNNRSDYTALLTWGVFSDDELTGGNSHIILLNAINVRVEFHELKALAMREWEEWSPDSFIVEKKSSGTPLFQELRRTGIPVQEFTPHRGTGDKIARLNAVSDIVRSGMVWYPSGKRWADEVIEQVAAFPNAGNDDMVDCTSMALARFRNGGFIRLNTDELDEITYPRKAAYY